MANYVKDKFFRFPVKLYDVYSVMNAEKQEDEDEKESGHIKPVSVDYAVSYYSCKPETIVSWMEHGHKEQSAEELMEGGFPVTLVFIETKNAIQMHECLWPTKKFEKELNEKMEAYIA